MKLGDFSKKIFFWICITACLIAGVKPALASSVNFWNYRCVDTVKISRDKAREWKDAIDVTSLVAKQVEDVKSLGANCIAIGTPYDDEFVPFLKIWIAAAREKGLIVWFRGNLSGWEGWFDYPVMTDVRQHHEGILKFVSANPGLFQDGDIFTPAPEPEMGKVIGDPRGSNEKTQAYLRFLVDSYGNCQNVFAQIHKQVQCGYFSVNGDIAKDVLTPDVVQRIGNRVVVDHYVNSPEKMVADLKNLKQKFPGAEIVLGEFGAPVPDINGKMNQDQQAEFVNRVLHAVVASNLVSTVNYWTLTGGSTAIYDDNGNPYKVAGILKKYFNSYVVSGKVLDPFGNAISEAKIHWVGTNREVTTDKNGAYELALPADEQAEIEASADGYETQKMTVVLKGSEVRILNFELKSENAGFWYHIKLFFHKLF